MGSIITAMSVGRPLVIMPRRAHFGETRSDHQYDTALRFGGRPGIHSAMNEHELPRVLDQVISLRHNYEPLTPPSAEPQLVKTVREFILNEPLGKRATP